MARTSEEPKLLKDKKSQIRRRLLARRKSFSKEWIQQRSQIIIDKLLTFPLYKKAKVIHTYVSLPRLGEVETQGLIKQALQDKKTVVVPVTNFASRKIACSRLRSMEELEEKPSGLKEPKQEYLEPVELKLIDLVILPGVAFDLHGNRIGMGGGFYDRFLAQLSLLPVPPPTVALAYQFQIVDEIEPGPQDVRVEWIITEKGIYRTKNS